jgi:transcriptional regulator with XRE-family HTH domain
LTGFARDGIALAPPRDIIANFVRFQRAVVGWKQDALASIAGLSLSTIQRIERAEEVSAESLERVAAALHQKPGAFTAPRVPLTVEALKEKLEQFTLPFESRQWVTVRPLRTQPQIAELAQSDLYLIDDGRIDDECHGEVAALQETLDFVSFVLVEEDAIVHSRPRKPIKRRELYATVLDLVQTIEKRSRSIALAGTYTADTGTKILPQARVGLIAFFAKSADPGAVKRRTLSVPSKVNLAEAWQRFCSETE